VIPAAGHAITHAAARNATAVGRAAAPCRASGCRPAGRSPAGSRPGRPGLLHGNLRGPLACLAGRARRFRLRRPGLAAPGLRLALVALVALAALVTLIALATPVTRIARLSRVRAGQPRLLPGCRACSGRHRGHPFPRRAAARRRPIDLWPTELPGDTDTSPARPGGERGSQRASAAPKTVPVT